MSGDLTLRTVEPDDFEPLALLWNAGWQVGHAAIAPPGLSAHRDLPSFRARIARAPESFWVAVLDGQTAGFIRIVGAELDQFYVAPAKIGQGIARPLMRLAEGRLRDAGVARAHLIASVGNDRAIRFYEREGWENCGEQMADVTTMEGTFPVPVMRLEKTLIS